MSEDHWEGVQEAVEFARGLRWPIAQKEAEETPWRGSSSKLPLATEEADGTLLYWRCQRLFA